MDFYECIRSHILTIVYYDDCYLLLEAYSALFVRSDTVTKAQLIEVWSPAQPTNEQCKDEVQWLTADDSMVFNQHFWQDREHERAKWRHV